METINNGRNNQMPSHKAILSEAKIHLLTAYVWGLSHQANESAPATATTADASASATKEVQATSDVK
jgi:cytochrome c oxidase cbb3-type subunit 3